MRTISNCRSCNASQLTEVLSLGNLGLSEFKNGVEVEKYPLNLVLCENCKLVQLKETCPPDKLYTDNYGYRSGINNTIRADLKSVVDDVLSLVTLDKDDNIFDIGSNDGTLIRNYPKEKGITTFGFEPVKKFAVESSSYIDVVYNGYYPTPTFKTDTHKAKVITVISCFYDLDDPNIFVEALKHHLAENGIIVIQQNYVGGMLKQNAFDNVVHEHLEYYSLLSLENLLNRHGLEVFKVSQNSINGGSFRTFIAHTGSREVEQSVLDLRSEEEVSELDNKWIYADFAHRVRTIKDDLFTFIRGKVNQGKKVYVYGASTRGNTLLQYCELGPDLITAAVERNPEKWGTEISSLHIPIISEEQARKEEPDYLLVLPWYFRTEFLKREEDYLNRGGQFIFPMPDFQVIGYEDIRNNS